MLEMIQTAARKARLAMVLTLITGALNFAAPPATQPDDEEVAAPKQVRVDAAAKAELEVVRATSGHLLVKPTVNGQDIGWFIFDTGAGITCIDKTIAEKLSLPDAGEITASGMGGDKQSRLRMLESLQLGPITMNGAPVLELDLRAFQIFMGRPIAGVIGYEVFNAAAFEIDFESPRIVVHPSDFALPANTSWNDLSIIRRRPYLTGSIEGNPPGLFVLDIGSNTPLIVHTAAVNEFKLLDGRETKSGFSGGVGGMKKVQSGIVKTFTLCGQTIEQVDTTFSQSEKGVTAGRDAQGTIGVGVLKGYVLVVNYPTGKVAMIKK